MQVNIRYARSIANQTCDVTCDGTNQVRPECLRWPVQVEAPSPPPPQSSPWCTAWRCGWWSGWFRGSPPRPAGGGWCWCQRSRRRCRSSHLPLSGGRSKVKGKQTPIQNQATGRQNFVMPTGLSHTHFSGNWAEWSWHESKGQKRWSLLKEVESNHTSSNTTRLKPCL